MRIRRKHRSDAAVLDNLARVAAVIDVRSDAEPAQNSKMVDVFRGDPNRLHSLHSANAVEIRAFQLAAIFSTGNSVQWKESYKLHISGHVVIGAKEIHFVVMRVTLLYKSTVLADRRAAGVRRSLTEKLPNDVEEAERHRDPPPSHDV